MIKNVVRSTAAALATTACLLAASLGCAQNHANGLVFTGGSGNPVALGHYNGGTVNTIIPAGALGSTVTLYRGTLDIDNASYVIPYFNIASDVGLLHVDRQQNRSSIVLSTLSIFAPQVRHVRLSEDGGFDVLMSGGLLGNPSLSHVNRAGRITTLIASASINSPMAFTRDIDTGDYYIWDAGGLFTPDRLHHVAADGSSITSIIQLPASIATNLIDVEIDHDTGHLFVSSTRGVQRIDPVGGLSTVIAGGIFNLTGPMYMDRTSSPRPRLVAVVGSTNPSPASLLYSIDLNTHAITTISTTALLTPTNDAFPDRSANLVTLQRGPASWELSVSIPGAGNKPYAVPLGVSGARPGFFVGRRRVALNPDVFTFLSVNGLMGPIYRNGLGRLDNAGRASAILNLRGIPGLTGLRVFAVAAAVDPTAPNGLSVITDPVSFLL